jgi:hypothetical protein
VRLAAVRGWQRSENGVRRRPQRCKRRGYSSGVAAREAVCSRLPIALLPRTLSSTCERHSPGVPSTLPQRAMLSGVVVEIAPYRKPEGF